MGPGFESQPNHSDQSAFRREALFSFMADSELAQVRTGMKKEQVSASAEARFDPLHVGDVGYLLHQSTITIVAENTEGDQDD